MRWVGAAALLIVEDHLQRRLVEFHFIAHVLNERPLLFQFRFKGINFFLLLPDCPMLFKNSLSNIAFTAS